MILNHPIADYRHLSPHIPPAFREPFGAWFSIAVEAVKPVAVSDIAAYVPMPGPADILPRLRLHGFAETPVAASACAAFFNALLAAYEGPACAAYRAIGLLAEAAIVAAGTEVPSWAA
jgi:hypothetical protein